MLFLWCPNPQLAPQYGAVDPATSGEVTITLPWCLERNALRKPKLPKKGTNQQLWRPKLPKSQSKWAIKQLESPSLRRWQRSGGPYGAGRYSHSSPMSNIRDHRSRHRRH